MKLYEKKENGLNVYDYTLNPNKVYEFKQSILAEVPESERVYYAETDGKFLLASSEISIPYFFLNNTFQKSIGSSYYHAFKSQEDPEENWSVVNTYYHYMGAMPGTIHTFAGPEEYFLKTSDYKPKGDIFVMPSIIKVPEALFNLEALLGEDDDDDLNLAIMFEPLFDLSLPFFYDESFMQSMYHSGLVTAQDVQRKLEASEDILNLKRRRK